MKPFRFVHTADLHLDSPFRGLSLPERLRDVVRDASVRVLDRIVRTAIKEQADFVLVCGDVYDAAERSLRAQLQFLKAAEALADHGIGLFVICGNHDPEAGVRGEWRWPDNTRVFTSGEPQRATALRRDGTPAADVYGVSFRESRETANLARRFRPAAGPTDLYRIAMLHCNVDGQEGHDDYAPCRKTELVSAGFDYWALGHIHSRAVLHERPWIVYPGNPQGRHAKETGPKGVYVVTVDGGEADLRFEATDEVRWLSRDVVLDERATAQDAHERLRTALALCEAEAEGRSAIVRLHVTAGGGLARDLGREETANELLQELREERERIWERDPDGRFVWPERLVLRPSPDSLRRKEALLAEDSFLGDLVRLARDLADDEARRAQFEREALADMLGAPRFGRLLGGVPAAERRAWLEEAGELALQLLTEGDGRVEH